jgi:hypothetical protein
VLNKGYYELGILGLFECEDSCNLNAVSFESVDLFSFFVAIIQLINTAKLKLSMNVHP